VMPLGDSFKDRYPLGAHREPIRGVLDVDAGEDGAIEA